MRSRPTKFKPPESLSNSGVLSVFAGTVLGRNPTRPPAETAPSNAPTAYPHHLRQRFWWAITHMGRRITHEYNPTPQHIWVAADCCTAGRLIGHFYVQCSDESGFVRAGVTSSTACSG